MMGKIGPNGNQTKAIILAFIGGVIAAVAAMFIPTGMLESFTGATGLSELIPATAPPLGATARAIIAFIAGSAVLLLLIAFGLRRREAAAAPADMAEISYDETAENDQHLGDRLSGFKSRFGKFPRPSMTWDRREDDMADLGNLPKLRNNDAHPDAPARRPISALTDLADTNLVPPAPPPEILPPPAIASDQSPAIQRAKPAAIEMEQNGRPSLAEMVTQMEIAVALRKQQLQDLEKVAEQVAMHKAAANAAPSVAIAPSVDAMPMGGADYAPVARPIPSEKAALEIISNSDGADDDSDDIDAALHAALATLHRMNRTAG